MNTQRKFAISASVLCLSLGAILPDAGRAAAQGYPNRVIKLVVPYAAGGPSDSVARTVADKMSVSLGQPIVIENRAGAGGNIGTETIARAAPDGYTLGWVLSTTLAANPSLYKKVPFDPDKDFRPISILTLNGMMLVVHPSVPIHTVAEFVAFAKAAATRREPITYAHGGIGTPGHLTMEKFRLHAGFDAIQVPYRGNAPMVVDLVTGQLKFGFVAASGMMDHVQAGRLRGLAVSRASRSPLAPDVPTIGEAGHPGFNVESYNVMVAPTGIPDSIAALLEREAVAALKHRDVIERLRIIDTTPNAIVGEEMRARLRADRAEWARVVAAANIRLD